MPRPSRNVLLPPCRIVAVIFANLEPFPLLHRCLQQQRRFRPSLGGASDHRDSCLRWGRPSAPVRPFRGAG